MTLYHTSLRPREKVSGIGSQTAVKSPPGTQMNTTMTCNNEVLTWLGDGFCDDNANTEACLYDLGDCCDYLDYNVSQSTCSECICIVDLTELMTGVDCHEKILTYTLYDGMQVGRIGDGICNSPLNNVDEFFDAGDCCYDDSSESQCILSNMICNSETLGDGLCQDYNNGPLCDFDLGDCCIGYQTSGGITNHQECCYCQCHEHNFGFWN